VCTQNLVFTLRLLPRPPPMPSPPLAHERAPSFAHPQSGFTHLSHGGFGGDLPTGDVWPGYTSGGVSGTALDQPTSSRDVTSAEVPPHAPPPLVTKADLARALAKPPPLAGEHAPFVLGWPRCATTSLYWKVGSPSCVSRVCACARCGRWDSFDNCFVLMSSDVALFFERHYYDLMRPTHTTDAGATLGAAWSRKHGR
jgi:hypothetical protein